MGGENDIRGFDVRSLSPVAFLPTATAIALRNPDGSIVPKDPSNRLSGPYTIPVPVDQITFPGGDLSVVTNAEYRITIAGPVALAPFFDFGFDPILRKSQLRINNGQFNTINSTPFGCPALDPFFKTCVGAQKFQFSQNLSPLGNSNWQPRASMGLELQVFLPVVNAPFRIYWAYNPLRLNDLAQAPVPITRSMFPPANSANGAAGEYTFAPPHHTASPPFPTPDTPHTIRCPPSKTRYS